MKSIMKRFHERGQVLRGCGNARGAAMRGG